MSSVISPTTLFSGSQRRCHILLLLFLPDMTVTDDKLCSLNHVSETVTQQDIAAVAEEISHFYRLAIHRDANGRYALQGSELDRRLCLLHWLRRAIRLTPDFIRHHFRPALRQQLRRYHVETMLCDEKNLQALIKHCASRLGRKFSEQDNRFLQLFMLFLLCRQESVHFTGQQQHWLSNKAEYSLARDVIRHWQKRGHRQVDAGETDFFTLLLNCIHSHSAQFIRHHSEQALMQEVRLLVQRFQTLSDVQFRHEQGLCNQLYSHLSQALNRNYFAIGINNTLAEEAQRLYPKLLRTTRCALSAFEKHYGITFSDAEQGLIAVIFGAWLMQESALKEKHILLLTHNNNALEKKVEYQLRELTLMPLNIKYQSVEAFQHYGVPKGVVLVVSPYATPLPLYSPSLIHAKLPLSDHQQQMIRSLLEA